MTQPASGRLHQQDGFTMAIVMGVLLLATTLGLAAFTASRGDIHVSAVSKDRKQAYAAAEAGLNWYQSRLSGDNAYWAKCTSVPPVATGQPAPVYQQWNGTGADPRTPRLIPGSTASYAIELLPAPGKASCNTAVSDANMIDPDNGNFRIRSTGFYNGQKRSIVARFRRARFLDFLWFTDFETTDPLAYPDLVLNAGPPPYTYVDWANDNCGNKYRSNRSQYCSEIQFASFDKLKGPLHSNDSLLICGGATFGRAGSSDKVESSQNENTAQTGSPNPGWRPSCDPTNPNFQTPFKYAQPTLQMPSTNASLNSNALAANTYTGETVLVLKGNVMDITNNGTTRTNVAWPTNGLLWVKSGSCSGAQKPIEQQYTRETAGCANVVVKGTYAKDLTISSDKDIVVNGDLTRTGDVLMGLIANQFVRVYHPTQSAYNPSDPTKNDCVGNQTSGRYGSYFSTVTIQAAILSLQHSFTADNYACGAGLSTLTITGAVAQRYRGPVGRGGSATAPNNGFIKDYNYDDRLKYRNPPYFLDPVNAAWRVLRTNEQVPAR